MRKLKLLKYIVIKTYISALICIYLWGAFLLLPKQIDSSNLTKSQIAAEASAHPITSPVTTSPTAIHSQEEQPTHIIIASASINAPVQPTGNTPDGSTMEVPYIFDSSFWYKYSAYPDTLGNVIIAGHLDGYYEKPAVFWNLNLVKIGDRITIQTANHYYTYTVIQKSIVGINDSSQWINIMNPVSTTKKLTIITCSGDWIPSLRTRTDRVVITASE